MNSGQRDYKWRRGHEFRAIAAICAASVGMVGCVSSDGAATARRASPPPSADVSKNQAWKDAEALAALDPARLTVIGSGDSMKPVYGENTVLVLQKVPFESLTAGMNVAYRNQAGKVVLHRLIARDGDRRWRVRGLNNENEDHERVTPENLLGIVYAAFANDAVL
jgi:hypothetical protein